MASNWRKFFFEKISTSSDLNEYIVGVGDNYKRKKLYEEFYETSNITPRTIIAGSAYISKRCTIGKGVMVSHNSVVNISARIGSNSIINSGVIIEHDVVVGDHCHIAPGTVVCGGVTIGPETFIGANVTIKPNIKIGKSVTVGAGSVVTKNLDDFGVYLGVPAKMVLK